ncbi:MAG: hypothetical protein H6926_03460 [Chromatiales bacterium]|nr:hypothetical protein [Chromatiales bacterium]
MIDSISNIRVYFDSLAMTITSMTGVMAISAVILGWAFVSYLFFRFRVAPVVRQIDRAIHLIEPIGGEADFFQNFEAFDQRIRENPVVAHVWSEFGETLIKDPELEPPALRNTRSAAEYFSRANVLGQRLNLRFYSALPNLLTGTGILGTFVGLVAGIWLASQGLASSDPHLVKEALTNLLNGASLAFFTSIVGLVTSILFSWSEKHWTHKLDGRLRSWNEALEGRLQRVTEGSMIAEHLKESRQQTEVLTQFTNDLAYQIAEAFQERITESIGPTMERLIAAVEAMQQDQGRRNDDALLGMISKFSESLSGAAGQELTALGSTLESLNLKLEGQIKTLTDRQRSMDEASEKSMNDFIDAVQGSLSQMQSGVGDSLQQIVQELGEMVGEVANEVRKAADDAALRLAELGRNFETALSESRQVLQSARELAEDYQRLMTETNGAVSQMNTAGQAMSNLVEPIGKAADGFIVSAKAAVSVSERNEQIAERFGRSVEQLTAYQDEIREAWEEYVGRFESVDTSLELVFRQLSEGLESYAEQVNGFMTELDNKTGSITSQLAGATNELSEAVEELSGSLGRKQ